MNINFSKYYNHIDDFKISHDPFFLTMIVQHESDSEYFKFELCRTHEHERRLIRVQFDSSQKKYNNY